MTIITTGQQKMTHDQLAHCLAEDLYTRGRIVVERVNLGSKYTGSTGNRGIVDVLCFQPHYNRPDITIYEAKISRGDFLSDVRAGKWRKYQPFCHRVVFACPYGMIQRDEVPAECGLCTWNAVKKTWATARRGQDNTNPEIDLEMMMAVMLAWDKRVRAKELQMAAMRNTIDGGSKYLYSLPQIFGDRVGEALQDKQLKDNAVMKKNAEIRRLENIILLETGKHPWEFK